ncbi:MAG: hydroxyacid dehydrogenase [Conexivisphaerales archaeon]
MPKILITEPMPLINEELKILKQYGEVVVCKKPDKDEIMRQIEDADILMVVYAKIDDDIIRAGKRLRGIVRYGIGIDNIDLKVATENKIIVANVPGYATNAVADFTMSLILCLERKICKIDKIMKSKNWGLWTSPSMEIIGTTLNGKVLGLIGIGRIGSAVAHRARAFGLSVLSFDPMVTKEAAKELNIELTSLDDIFSRSDIISLHAPLTDQTFNIINKDSISKMKDGVIIINTARGRFIDMDALINGIKNKKIGGAALDVFPVEPPDSNSEIFNLENVILSPHIAWFTNEAERELEMTAVQHVVDILENRTPVTVVNPSVLQYLGRK